MKEKPQKTSGKIQNFWNKPLTNYKMYEKIIKIYKNLKNKRMPDKTPYK